MSSISKEKTDHYENSAKKRPITVNKQPQLAQKKTSTRPTSSN